MIIEASKQVGLDFNYIIFTNLIEDKQRQTVIFKTKSLQLALPILRLNNLWIMYYLCYDPKLVEIVDANREGWLWDMNIYRFCYPVWVWNQSLANSKKTLYLKTDKIPFHLLSLSLHPFHFLFLSFSFSFCVELYGNFFLYCSIHTISEIISIKMTKI